jgi:hypothetical protein
LPLTFTKWLKGLWEDSQQATRNVSYFKPRRVDFREYRKHSDTFIETGTCFGESVQAALDAGFTKVKSVEAQPNLYKHSKSRFEGNPDVQIYLGKSEERLKEMLQGIPIPSVFWLDAHPAGNQTYGHDDLIAKGGDSENHQDKILSKEIAIILEHGRHVILIDDQQGLATASKFIDLITDFKLNYEFHLIDEERGETTYCEKILVCEPVLLPDRLA